MVATSSLIAMLSLLIMGPGAIGLLAGVIVLIVSIGTLIVFRKLMGRGPWIAFMAFGLLGMGLWFQMAIRSFPATPSTTPSTETYEQAMHIFFLIGLTPVGSALGLLSLFLRK